MVGIERIPEKGATLDVFEMSLILPVPAREKNSVVFEERDGSDIQEFKAKAVEMLVDGKKVFRASDIKITAFITDARLAFACSTYNDGEALLRPGEWPEQLLKIGTKTFAAARRHHKMLVGQARYPWIASVGGTSKVSWLGDRGLQIVEGLDGDRTVQLVLELPKDVKPTEVAAEIARRAAVYRLASEPDLTDDQRTELTALTAAAPQVHAEKNKIAPHNFPHFWSVGETSARFAPEPVASATSDPAEGIPPV